jgi:hypothetical protein
MIPASMIASRGCLYRCTFCSVVKYEQLQTGRSHRSRSNDDLIAEIRMLHDRLGVSAVNFEDDNFILTSRRGIAKLHDLCDRLIALPFSVQFTFFCRADGVSLDLFSHLQEAGLSGVYLGIESVFPGDLEFFHKDSKLETNFEALGILRQLGYSTAVDADRRVMLGYITWHPLSSFEGLRATGRFVREWECPPKLLRRKLRLYSETEVLGDVIRLGLIDPGHPRGWVYRDRRLETVETSIDEHFLKVNGTRDKLRSVEKAAGSYDYSVDGLEDFKRIRVGLDDGLYAYFDDIIELAAATDDEKREERLAEFAADRDSLYERFLEHNGVTDLVRQGFEACGFPQKTVDLFRK